MCVWGEEGKGVECFNMSLGRRGRQFQHVSIDGEADVQIICLWEGGVGCFNSCTTAPAYFSALCKLKRSTLSVSYSSGQPSSLYVACRRSSVGLAPNVA